MKQQLVRLAAVALAVSLSFNHPIYAVDDDDTGWAKTEITFVLDINVINACNSDETVHIFGEGLISTKTRFNSDGSIDIKEKDHFTGDGAGESGSQYTFDEKASIEQSIGPNPDGTPFSYSERRRQKLKGAGGSPDQVITYDILLIIEGDGTVTVDIFDVQIECN